MDIVIEFVIAIVTTALLFFVIGFFIGSNEVNVRCDSCGRIYKRQDVRRLSSNDDLLILCDSCYEKTIGDLVKDKMIFLENKEEQESRNEKQN